MPLYPDGVLDEVRNAVNIVALVSDYVALKKRGRNYVARCPFHSEKTPSFNVSEEKQIFMCFGCGVGGDAFKFVMQAESLGFPEAVRFLASRYGVALPEPASRAEPSDDVAADVLRGAMEETAAFFHRALTASEEGREGLEYLLGRGVTRPTIDRFRLGYSPQAGETLLGRLQKKGFALQALLDCGLVKRSEDGTRCYDTFRGRIMFPITDVRGRVIAFGGRALGDRQPKYLNSPETRLYSKSRNLFGLSFSRDAIKRENCAILVEGYMDFVVPFQHGVENLVASLGTSLTQQQVQLLGRYTKDVVVSYDPDSAGLAAAQRSLDLFLEEDFRVCVLRLPQGQDPDAFIRSEGADGYRRRVKEAAPYLDFVLEAAIQGQGRLDEPKNKVQVINSVLPYLARVPNALERSDYVFRFAQRLRIDDQQLLAEVRRAAQQKRAKLSDAPAAAAPPMKLAEKRLLQFLLHDGSIQVEVLPGCSMPDFDGLAARRIFLAIGEAVRQGETATFGSLHRRFAGEPEQALLAELEMEEVPEDLSLASAASFYSALRKIRLSSYKKEILLKIDEAAKHRDDELLDRLIQQRAQVDRELISLAEK